MRTDNSYLSFIIILFFIYYVRGSLGISKTNCDVGSTDKSCKKETIRLALPHINPVKVGYEQNIELSNGKTLIMKTLSLAPPIFEIPEFFSPEECELVIDMAKHKGMKDSPVVKDTRSFANETTRETFDEWDTNNDGFVDSEEMMYLKGNSDLYLLKDDINKMFEELTIDKDEHDKMSFEEFQEVTVDGIKKYLDRLREGVSSVRSRNSQQTWLWHDEDELLQYEDLLGNYHDRFAKITTLPSKIIQESEPIQVVHYPENGHYHCHHDSEVINTELPCCVYGEMGSCRLCRYLTVAVFLNDVQEGGELAFPVADNSTYNWKFWTNESYTKCNMVKHCSKSNVIVKPKAGKAVLFYNHLFDKTTQWSSALDPRALVGECQVKKGEKWIANAWINVIGDGINDLKSWKMGTNWLSENNLNTKIVSALKTKYEEPKEEAIENRYTQAKNALGDASSDSIEGPPKIKRDNDDEDVSIAPYDTLEGINMNEVKKEFLPQPQELKSPEPPSTSYKQPIKEEEDPNSLPKGPKVHLEVTPAPLPLPLEKMTLKEPNKPTMDSMPSPPQEGHRVLKSIMLLIDELDQIELEILARNLHTRLKLVCVPLMLNPMGTLR